MRDRIVEWAMKLQSLAQAGLWYGRDVYDRERYSRVRAIAAQMMAERTDIPVERITELFCGDRGYQTPKADTRAAVFRDGRILLVQERDGRWSLPGGWCEYNLSPAVNAVKETREEAGLEVRARRLIAVQDRDRHNRPPYAWGVIILFYLCDLLGGAFAENPETVGSGFFAADALPPLAEEKCTAEQVRMCFEANADPHWEARFD